ncbi:cation transporter [Mycobacterium colombiense]|uniref:Cation diffusion facilitator family transporter n=1 Tax=Mycobacterium colombiense CECT 3035 TaxID=1041522 RepID=J4SCF6_9MYCO|nr:cation transporter [Mycobacterium colombiense]EJO86135.1 cation diffusion facilitator family transporter [Mycobacterium colombiense CECT 3035]
MSQRRRLGIVLGLNVSLIAALVIVGLTAHSVGVIAAAGDTAADSVALVLGLIAVTVRDRTDYAWRSAAIPIVALINGIALLVVVTLIAVEAIGRLTRGVPEVHGLPVLVVSAATMAVLLVGAWVLGASAANENLHMRSVLLDTLADAAAAAAIAVAGAVMALTGRFFWLDSVLALAIAALVAVPATTLCVKACAAMRGKTVDFTDD